MPKLATNNEASFFEAWSAERRHLARELDRTPKEGPARDPLFDRSVELEQLILNTPSLELPAVRAKAQLLTWYMKMEQADGLPAMLHIRDYIERQA